MKSSKNAGVALLCASLLNRGRTTLRRVARIEEVYRLLEVLGSIGVRTRWINEGVDLEIVPPAELDLDSIDAEAAVRRATVRAALAGLEARDRELIALRFHAGLSTAEIAAVLRISPTNASTRLHRALTRLREACHAPT